MEQKRQKKKNRARTEQQKDTKKERHKENIDRNMRAIIMLANTEGGGAAHPLLPPHPTTFFDFSPLTPLLFLRARKLTPKETRPSSMAAIAPRVRASSHHRVGRSLPSKVLSKSSARHHVIQLLCPRMSNSPDPATLNHSKPQAFCGKHSRTTFPSSKTKRIRKIKPEAIQNNGDGMH